MGETGGNSNTKDSNAGPTAHAEKKLPAKKASAKSTPPKLSKEGAEAPSNDLLEKILTGLSDIKQQQQTTDKNFTNLLIVFLRSRIGLVETMERRNTRWITRKEKSPRIRLPRRGEGKWTPNLDSR